MYSNAFFFTGDSCFGLNPILIIKKVRNNYLSTFFLCNKYYVAAVKNKNLINKKSVFFWKFYRRFATSNLFMRSVPIKVHGLFAFVLALPWCACTG